MSEASRKFHTRWARILPWRARTALLRRNRATDVPSEDPVSSLCRLAQSCGVTGFLATGKYGLIQSTSDDRMIFASYARTGSWSERVNTILEAFFRSRSTGTYI